MYNLSMRSKFIAQKSQVADSPRVMVIARLWASFSLQQQPEAGLAGDVLPSLARC